jgi:hypothetical protein
MRPRGRPGVEPQHGGDRIAQVVGQRDRAGAGAVLADGAVFETLQRHAEGRLDLRDGAGQHDDALRRVDPRHGQLMPARERLEFRDVGGRGAETLRERLARDRLRVRIAAREAFQQGVEMLLFLPSQHHRDMYRLGGIACAETGGFGRDLRFIAGVKMSCHVRTLLGYRVARTARKSDMADRKRFRPECRMRYATPTARRAKHGGRSVKHAL